jgi:hypothetical protein
MPTKRTVATIKANLLRPALTSHFEVEIAAPSNGEFTKFLKYNGVNYKQQQLNLLCSEATLPGSRLATLEINNDFTGVTERHAYRRVYDEGIDFTFYVDAENYLPIRFFETWIKFIVDESRGRQNDKKILSDVQIKKIRSLQGKMIHQKIADIFNISRTYVTRILNKDVRNNYTSR